jgi:hypothetical protein
MSRERRRCPPLILLITAARKFSDTAQQITIDRMFGLGDDNSGMRKLRGHYGAIAGELLPNLSNACRRDLGYDAHSIESLGQSLE